MENPWKRFRQEASRFLAVGLIATTVALVVFNFLVHGYGAMDTAWFNDKPELAYVIANSIGMAISFRGTKVWAFRDRKTHHADGGVVAFVVINLATMLIPMTCLWISRGLGLDDPISDNVSANMVGLALANAARFFLFREFVFLRVDDPELVLDLELATLHEHTHELPAVLDEISDPGDPSTGLPRTDPAPPAGP